MSSVRFKRLAGSKLTSDLRACRDTSKRCIGSFCQEQTFAVADANDRAWVGICRMLLDITSAGISFMWS